MRMALGPMSRLRLLYDDDVKEGNAIEVDNDNHMKWEGEREKWE